MIKVPIEIEGQKFTVEADTTPVGSGYDSEYNKAQRQKFDDVIHQFLTALERAAGKIEQPPKGKKTEPDE